MTGLLEHEKQEYKYTQTDQDIVRDFWVIT